MISIIIATYNRKDLLPRCLKSIFAQTFSDFEIIVVDDGSTDGTGEMISREFSERRIRYFALPENRGATFARNFGLEKARGDYFMVWDSDDELLPHALEKLAAAAKNYSAAVAISAPTRCFKGEREVAYPEFPAGEVTLSRILCRKLPNNEKIRMVKTAVAGDIRYRAKNIDFLFNVELRERGYWHHLTEPLGKVYLSSDAVSLTIKRRRPDPRSSMERAPHLAAFLGKYGAALKDECPDIYCLYAYGASVGLLLLKQKRQVLSLMFSALKTGRAKASHWLFFAFAVVPLSPLILLILFRLNRFKRYPLFVFFGVLGTAFILAVTYFLTEFFGFWYLLSYIIATFLGWTLNFLINSRITFRGHPKDGYFFRYLRFMKLYIVLGLLSYALVYTLTSIIGFHYLVSTLIIIFPMSLVTFSVNRRRVFSYQG